MHLFSFQSTTNLESFYPNAIISVGYGLTSCVLNQIQLGDISSSTEIPVDCEDIIFCVTFTDGDCTSTDSTRVTCSGMESCIILSPYDVIQDLLMVKFVE